MTKIYKYYLQDNTDETKEFLVSRLDDETIVVTSPDETKMTLNVRSFDSVIHLLTTDDTTIEQHVSAEKDNRYTVSAPNHNYKFTVLNERKMRMAQASGGLKGAGGPELTSPMAGKIILVKVEEGDDVESGDIVVIIEAMKMENDLQAHLTGTISKVHVAPGDIVDIGDVLVEIESQESI